MANRRTRPYVFVTTSRLLHQPALDGLRGVAVLAVLLFHSEGLLVGGYLGVDLFFVLSGYLITSLIVLEHDQMGGLDVKRFWARRAKRLLPPLVLLTPALGLYALLWATPRELPGLAWDALATLTYVSNWRAIVVDKGYWDLFAARSPLEHTWSLAIEAQFYFVWPSLAAWVLKHEAGRKRLLYLCGVLFAASAVLLLWFYDAQNTNRAYLGTDTRASAIISGAALALVLKSSVGSSVRVNRWANPLGILCLSVLLLMWLLLDGKEPVLYRGGLWVSQLASVGLIACAVVPSSAVAKLFTWRVFRYLGATSYGLYLWHWPVNCVVTTERTGLEGVGLLVVRFGLALTFATVSYWLVERPEARVRWGARRLLLSAASVLGLVAVLGFGAPPKGGALAHAEGEVADPIARPEHFQIVMLGDSTSNSLGWALRGLREPDFTVHLLGVDGCNVLLDSCRGARWQKYGATLGAEAIVVVLGGAFMYGMHLDDEWREPCYPRLSQVFEDNLRTRLTELARAAPDRVWLATVPYPLGPWRKEQANRFKVDCVNASLRATVASVPGVHLLDLAERVCPNGECQRTSSNGDIRPDGVHYSVAGAKELSGWIMAQLRR